MINAILQGEDPYSTSEAKKDLEKVNSEGELGSKRQASTSMSFVKDDFEAEDAH